MWQVLLAAAVAGSTGLVAKHLFGTNDADDPTPCTPPQQTGNPFHAPSACAGSQTERDGIFRFSSSGSRSGSGSKNSRIKKATRVKKSGCVEPEAEVPRKSARRFAVRLKRRKISKNVAPSSSASSSSKDSSLFGWGLGVGVMYMMSAGKSEISKLNIAVDETAKVVQELKSELDKKRSSYHLGISTFTSEVDAAPHKNYSNHTQLAVDKFSTGNRDPNDIKVSGRFDDGEYASSVLTEEPEPRVHEIDQLEAELESELQKLPWCVTEASHQEEIRPNLVETEVSAMDFNVAEGQNSDSYQFHGVVPAELDQKLCHLLIEQQEHQIVELESELNLAQSKLNSKEAELQALKDCVRRLTAFSLSTVSDDETEAHEEQEQTSEWEDYTNKTESESKKVVVGMKRPVDSGSCHHYVR